MEGWIEGWMEVGMNELRDAQIDRWMDGLRDV